MLLVAVGSGQHVLGDANVEGAHGTGCHGGCLRQLALGHGFVSQVGRGNRPEVSGGSSGCAGRGLGNDGEGVVCRWGGGGGASRIRGNGVKLSARLDFDRFARHQCESALKSCYLFSSSSSGCFRAALVIRRVYRERAREDKKRKREKRFGLVVNIVRVD